MAKRKPTPDSGRAPSIKAAAARLSRPPAWVVAAKEAGVDAFRANGAVMLAPVKEWIDANEARLSETADTLPLKDQKLVEEVRRLRLRNDRDAGKLVERAWVVERFHRIAGEINSIRVRSESEDAVPLAAAGGDVPMNRSVLRGVWDEIFNAFKEGAKHFTE